ncbi:MAG: hypothetical protein LBI10_11960 [Deltaproteobacteria bacterium]|jgi:hypothetical protein|nr:hypothetical protein [Deltaproteobacteria bacterium]
MRKRLLLALPFILPLFFITCAKNIPHDFPAQSQMTIKPLIQKAPYALTLKADLPKNFG